MNGKMYGNHYLGIYEQGFVRLKVWIMKQSMKDLRLA